MWIRDLDCLWLINPRPSHVRVMDEGGVRVVDTYGANSEPPFECKAIGVIKEIWRAVVLLEYPITGVMLLCLFSTETATTPDGLAGIVSQLLLLFTFMAGMATTITCLLPEGFRGGLLDWLRGRFLVQQGRTIWRLAMVSFAVVQVILLVVIFSSTLDGNLLMMAGVFLDILIILGACLTWLLLGSLVSEAAGREPMQQATVAMFHTGCAFYAASLFGSSGEIENTVGLYQYFRTLAIMVWSDRLATIGVAGIATSFIVIRLKLGRMTK